MKANDPSDDSLMKLLTNRPKLRESKQAFRLLFDRHGGLVLGYCTRLLADRSLAEDVAQEVWMKVIQNAETYEPRQQLRPWLLTIARNTSLNVMRRRKNWEELEDGHDVPEESADLLQSFVAENEARAIRDAIDALPEAQRTAISLLTIEGLPYDEIAHAMNLSLGSVKTHIHRARLALAESLKQHPRTAVREVK